jgi:hypothetical protein
MNKFLLLLVMVCFAAFGMAQQKPVAPAKPVAVTTATKPPVIVSTKELKKQLERNFTRKRYKAVLAIADTLLKRNKKDENAFRKKVFSKVYLKMDKSAIADLKNFYKNKDTAATIIAIIPYTFDFKSKNRSGDIYYKSAMAWAPKNGIPYILYGAEQADNEMIAESLVNSEKGFNLLNADYKKSFVSNYAMVLFGAAKKEEAYKLLETEITSGNTQDEVVRTYFQFFEKDNKLQEGIDKASAFIKQNPLEIFYVRRALMYSANGNNDKACEDAGTIAQEYSFDYWQRRFGCAEVMADVTPIQQRTYIYEVQFQGNTYDFRVTNPIVDMGKGLSFKFKMTGDVGIGGLITISKEAADTAHTQNNRFGNGDLQLTDVTTVWVSNAVFNDIKTKGETFISADLYGEKQYELINDEYNDDDEFYTVKVDDKDKYIRCIKIASKDGDEEIWINDDPKNPLILKMKLSFSIELKQVL